MINLPNPIEKLIMRSGQAPQMALSLFSRSELRLRDYNFSTASVKNHFGRQLLLDQTIDLSVGVLSNLTTLDLCLYDRTLLNNQDYMLDVGWLPKLFDCIRHKMRHLKLTIGTPGQHPLELIRANACSTHYSGAKVTWSTFLLDQEWPRLKSLAIKNVRYTASQLATFFETNNKSIESVHVVLSSCADDFPSCDMLTTIFGDGGGHAALLRLTLSKEADSLGFHLTLICSSSSSTLVCYRNRYSEQRKDGPMKIPSQKIMFPSVSRPLRNLVRLSMTSGSCIICIVRR